MQEVIKVLFSDKKRLIGLIFVGVVALGVIAGVFLVGEQKLFRPKADVESILFKDSQGNPLSAENGVPVTNSMNIKVELRAPQP